MNLFKSIGAVLLFAPLSLFAQNPSDGCAGVPALPVNATCVTTNYTLAGSYANGSLINASCFAAGNDRDDGWYSVTATSTGTMTIELTGDRAKTLAVWTACGGGTELGCHQTGNAATSIVSFAATNGTTYYVQIHRNGGNNGATMTGTICAHMPAGGGGGGGTHNIGDGDLTACTGTIYDSGGTGDYSNSETITETYCSDVAGQCISITFTSFSTESCCDDLTIYDGPNTGSPIIGTYAGTTSPGTITGTSGCLTFVWSSDGSIVDGGWEATISCAACPTCSDGIQNGLETGIDCGGPTCPACPCASAPVWNDEACCALPLTVNPTAACIAVTAGSVLNATASSGGNGCFGTADDDVWFSFVATNTSHYVSLINVAGSVTDMYHSVYEGACGAPTLVAGSCSDPNSQTVTGLTIGSTYYVRVYTYTSTPGQNTAFDVCIGSPPPPPTNDDPCSATAAVVNSNAVCTNVTAGYTVGGTSSMAGCTGTANDDVWFSFVALDPNQTIEIQNATGTTDMVHELFSGPCGSLTSIGCSDPDLSTYTSLTVGQTYFVRVYTYSSTGSNTGFDLCITSPCGISGAAPTCGLSYTHSTTAYNPHNYNSGTALTFTDDRFADSYTSLGFDFCFDGVEYSDVLVSSNGYLIFPGCYSAAPTEPSVTAGGYSAYSMYTDAPNLDDVPRNAILGPWQDIDPSIAGSSIRVETHGTAPNRVFVAKFNTVGMYSCTSLDFTGQIKLFETSNDIEIHIGEKTTCATWNGGGAIMGLSGYDGTSSVIPAGYNYSTTWTVPTGSPEGHSFSSGCGVCATPLPVELINFKGEAVDEDNLLTWSTVSERNNDYFVIEKSEGGANFTVVGTVPGNGNSNELISYSILDDNPSLKQFYRIRQVDFDGSSHYSEIISVNRMVTTGVTLYPNPSKGALFMDLEDMIANQNESMSIVYIDVTGKKVEESLHINGATKSYTLDKFASLDKGAYIVQVINEIGDVIRVEKIIKH